MGASGLLMTIEFDGSTGFPGQCEIFASSNEVFLGIRPPDTSGGGALLTRVPREKAESGATTRLALRHARPHQMIATGANSRQNA